MWPFQKRLKFVCPSCGFKIKLSRKRLHALKQEGLIRVDRENKPKIECHICHIDYMTLKN
jgi:hypothetical protein